MIDAPSVGCISMPSAPEKDDRSGGMGRWPGGLTNKIHAPLVPRGAIALKNMEGRVHDGRSADDLSVCLGPGQILLRNRIDDNGTRVADQAGWADVKLAPTGSRCGRSPHSCKDTAIGANASSARSGASKR